MEPSTIQQDSSPDLLHSSLPLDCHFLLAQARNTSSTVSTSSQRLDAIDPECLSPLDFPSSNPNVFSKARGSSHKAIKGSNMGQLRVKVFHYLQEKNETLCSLVTEEETSSYSASTSANTPAFIDSAQLRNSGETSISRRSSRNEISRQNSEETRSIGIRETSNVTTSHNNETESLVMSNPNSTQVTTDDSHIVPNSNAEASNAQGNNANAHDATFVDSLEFILEKTPIISIFMALICLALTSGIAVSVIDGKDTYSFLFIVLYVFLMYLLIEKIFKMFRACGTANPTLACLAKLEQFYNLLDALAILVIATVVNLRLAGVLESYYSGLCPLIMNFTLYIIFSRPPVPEKLLGIAKRGFFIVQFVLFTQKAEGELSISWKFVFCLGWIVLSKLFLKLVQSLIRIYKAFTGLSILSSISKSAKITGMIGLSLLGVDLAVLTLILFEICGQLDSPDQDIEGLKFWLTICQYLNACLLFFTTIAGADLLEFILSAAEHFYPFDEVVVKPKELEFSKKETYVMRMSSTYYKVIEKSEEDSIDQSVESEACEDNTCYICCGNEANGLVMDCGHGGICYECLKDYIQRKEECMECRKKVNSVLKIDNEVKKNKLYKGEEICSIVRK